MKKVFETNFRGRKLIVENGELAKQAHGSVLVRYGDTVVLSTVVMSKNVNLLADFFPLMVLYNEKFHLSTKQFLPRISPPPAASAPSKPVLANRSPASPTWQSALLLHRTSNLCVGAGSYPARFCRTLPVISCRAAPMCAAAD